jgi:ribosomal protein S18 acetylase RimI-like enzyme
MIALIDIQDEDLARQVLAVQLQSYQIESALIDYPNLPPLFENVADLQNSDETFVGYWLAGQLAGVLSYEQNDVGVHISRLVVHPNTFRRGIGRALLAWLETAVSSPHITVSTAAKNQPAIHLYQAQGYTIVQCTTLPDGLELVLLGKKPILMEVPSEG